MLNRLISKISTWQPRNYSCSLSSQSLYLRVRSLVW